jgi:hypothetical protein
LTFQDAVVDERLERLEKAVVKLKKQIAQLKTLGGRIPVEAH